MFRRRKEKQEEKIENFSSVILCNRYINTSEQIQEALLSGIKGYNFSKDLIYITQFPWDARDQASEMHFDYLFVDEVTDSKYDIEILLRKLKADRPELKIILLTSYVSQTAEKLYAEGTINTYMLMPFQKSHIANALNEVDSEIIDVQ